MSLGLIHAMLRKSTISLTLQSQPDRWRFYVCTTARLQKATCVTLRLGACRFHDAENCWSWSCSDIWDCSALPCLLGQLWLTNTQILRAERWFNYRIRREEVIRVVLNPGECTSVTAGAVVRSLVGTLLAGVVTEMALPPHRVTPLLTADFAASVIKEPAGEDVVHNDHAKSVALF